MTQTAAADDSPFTEPAWHDTLALAVLLAATLIAMGGLCLNEFTGWDDPQTIYQNPWLSPPGWQTLAHYATTAAGGLYIPLTYALWALVAVTARVQPDASGVTLNPLQFHAINVVCHLTAVVFAYRLIRLLRLQPFPATLGALLFAVHPLQVEPVAWVSGLKDVFSGMLAVIALWQYTRFAIKRQSGKPAQTDYFIAIALFILALLAKPSCMALPLGAVAIDHWGIGRRWKEAIRSGTGLLIAALPLMVVARSVQDSGDVIMPSLWTRPLIALDAIAFYLSKLVWPMRLGIDYGRTPAMVLAHGSCYWDWLVPITVAMAILKIARRPLPLAGIALFVAGLLPVLGLTPAGFQRYSTTADHYVYFSMLGAGIVLGSLLSDRHAQIARTAAAIAFIPLICLTLHQGGTWRNNVTLFTHTIDVNPASYIGYTNLGKALELEGDLPASLAAFEQGARLNADYAPAWHYLGDALVNIGRSDEGLAALTTAVDLQRKHPNERLFWHRDNALVGRLLVQRHRFAAAIGYLQVAAQSDQADTSVSQSLHIAQVQAATQP
jgi:hypothetical protein